MPDARVEALKGQLGAYAEGDTLDLSPEGTYEPQFTEPSPWGQPVAKEPIAQPPAPTSTPTPRRRRWPGSKPKPDPVPEPVPPPKPAADQPVAPPSASPSPEPELDPSWQWLDGLIAERPKTKLKPRLTLSSIHHLAQDLPWCAVAIWLHIGVSKAPPWALTAFGSALFISTLSWIWLLLETRRWKWSVLVAAIALSAIPVALQSQPILYTIPYLTSYLLGDGDRKLPIAATHLMGDGNRHYGQRAAIFSRVLTAIALSWPIAALILSTNLF